MSGETGRQMTYEELSESHRKLWYKNKELEAEKAELIETLKEIESRYSVRWIHNRIDELLQNTIFKTGE